MQISHEIQASYRMINLRETIHTREMCIRQLLGYFCKLSPSTWRAINMRGEAERTFEVGDLTAS